MSRRMFTPAPTTRSAPRVNDRRAATTQQRQPDASNEDAKARIVAKAVELVLANNARAPGVRTQSTRDAYRVRDFEEMALDFGVTARDMDRRRQTEERFERLQRDGRRADGSRVVLGDDGERIDLDQMRATRRSAKRATFRQFHEMRGRRKTAATLGMGGIDIEALVRSKPAIGEADIGFLMQSGVGEVVSGWISYMALNGMDGERAAHHATREGEPSWMVRALGESALSTGGVLVPDEVAEDYVELLYAATIFLQGNPMRMQLAGGVLTLPRVSGGGTAGWIGENTNITKSEQSFDAPRIALRYLAALVPFSNRLAMHTPGQLASLIVEDLVRQAGILIDVACIRGTGTSHQPLGVENQCPAANKFNQTGTTVAAITTDTAKVQRLVEDAKVATARPYWMLAPRTRWALMSARDGNNNLVWAREMAMGEFWGKPFGVSTNVPTNLGGGGNESKIYYVENSQEVYAEGVGADALRVDTQSGVAYHDGSGVVAAFSQDQSVSRVVQSADLVSRQNGNNIGLIEAVTIA